MQQQAAYLGLSDWRRSGISTTSSVVPRGFIPYCADTEFPSPRVRAARPQRREAGRGWHAERPRGRAGAPRSCTKPVNLACAPEPVIRYGLGAPRWRGRGDLRWRAGGTRSGVGLRVTSEYVTDPVFKIACVELGQALTWRPARRTRLKEPVAHLFVSHLCSAYHRLPVPNTHSS